MGAPPPQRSFWKTYTPRNVLAEIRSRLSRPRRDVRSSGAESGAPYDDRHARSVAAFYDRRHDDFLEVYGPVIQALRTKRVEDLLDHQIAKMNLAPDQRVLDAGCGVAAPAAHFARRAGVHVDAITISRRQYDEARARIEALALSDRVRVVLGDYHDLAAHFRPGSYDVVCFLESFGHSRAKGTLIESSWQMLKPGGLLYIKDLFRRLLPDADRQARVDREIRRIDEAYRYEVGDLNAVLTALRRRGFILDELANVALDLDQFEDLAISNVFQELTGIARIEDWDDYLFPVDFFELRCIRPEFDLDERPDRHFLQNRLHRSRGEASQASLSDR